MKPITLRNLPESVARRVREHARTNGISLNRAVSELLAERLSEAPAPEGYDDLDGLVGAWREDEAREFDRALAAQRAIAPELWG